MAERYSRLIEAGERALADGRHADACRHFAGALAMRASHQPLLARYIDACMLAGEDEGAHWALGRLMVLTPGDTQAAMLRARLAFKLRKPDWLAAAFGVVGALVRPGTGGPEKSAPARSDGAPASVPDGMTVEQAGLYRSIAAQIVRRRYDEADAGLARLAGMLPEHPEIWNLKGKIALGRADFLASYQAFEQALARDPKNLTARSYLIRMVVRSERVPIARAEEVLASFTPAERESAEVLVAESILRRHLGETDRAIALLERVEADIEQRADVAFLMVETLTGAGRFDECAPWLARLAARDPASATAFAAAAVARMMPPGSDLFRQAEKAAANPSMAQEERARANFALAQALREAGRHDASIERFETGNALLDRYYDPWEEDARADAQIRLIGPAVLGRAVDAERGKSHIFICGMPRSGSTLVAQILGSHPEAVSIGESPAFYSALDRAIEAGYPERVGEMPDTLLAELGEHYLSLMPRAAAGARFVVDKELQKFRYLGLLKLILPGARIVHTQRDPMDVCFSIFCHWFSGHPYAARYDTIAHFHHVHDRIMAHWQAVLQGDLYQLRYEDLVADLEPQARRLLEAVGMPFHPDCLNFHEARSMAMTSSMYQVRQKVYGSSVGAWKRHEARLEPLSRALAENPFGAPPEI